MAKRSNKISMRWIRQTCNEFRTFLDETGFPYPQRLGERGPALKYPEWLIMFIAVLSVKLKIKSYVQIHKTAVKYWNVIAEGMNLPPISERQLRERLKKPVISLENQQRSFFSYFLNLTGENVISADKMMTKAKGPIWHKKHKEKGIIPKWLRGIDRTTTWCKSNADGWVYGHGSFTLTSHKHPILGCFLWMRNSGNEAKRLWFETFHIKKHVDYVAMDSKADDYDLFRELKRQRKMNLITCCRQNMDKTPDRKKMIKFIKNRSIKRSTVKEHLGLNRCRVS